MTSTGTPLERYTAGQRRGRLVYAAVLTAVVLVFGTIFVVVWATGSAAHATLHTASRVPADLTLTDAPATQTRAWITSDRLADGHPQWHGTLVTYSRDTVRGRDARTGAVTWSYTRSDRTVCAVGQEIGYANGHESGFTVAVFDRSGNCDEVDTFDTATGDRVWARTLDQDGQPVDGRPDFQWTTSTVLVSTPQVVYAVDPVSGLNRWTYARYGCRIDHAVLGSTGALISQDCGAAVRCSGVKFCARGHQLFLRDGSAGKLDTSKPNYDQILWSRTGYTGRPTSAGTLVTAVPPGSDRLDVLSAKTGLVTRTVTLSPAPGSLGTVVAADTTATQLLWTGGTVYAVGTGSASAHWTRRTAGPPTVVDAADDDTPPTGSARVTVPTATGIAALDPSTGKVLHTWTLPAPASGSRVLPVGSGFAVASGTGTVVYR